MAPAALPSTPNHSARTMTPRVRSERTLISGPVSCELLGDAQQGAARARIARDFHRGGPHFPADEAPARPRRLRHDRQRRERRIDARGALHETLDQPVLEGM